MQEDQIEENQTKLDELVPIERGLIDFQKFDGQKSIITSYEIKDITTKFGKIKVLRLCSDKLSEIETKEGPKPVYASELFNLIADTEGRIGWARNEKGKLYKLLKKHKVDHPSKMIGKQIVIKVTAKEYDDGTTKDYLGFYL